MMKQKCYIIKDSKGMEERFLIDHIGKDLSVL